MLTIITPTYNEAENVEEFILTVSKVLDGVEHEIIIVDDNSPDETATIVKNLQNLFSRVRLLARRERGLAGAVLSGVLEAKYELCVITDCDLQHDVSKILDFREAFAKNGADLVIGYRNFDVKTRKNLGYFRDIWLV